ncbi:MAG: TrmH family RNA methyltransferase [Desulfobacterales bacterium]
MTAQSIDTATPVFLLLIDNIVDPHNLGALIRSALCADLTGVIIPKDRTALPSPTVLQRLPAHWEHIRWRLLSIWSTLSGN